MKVPQDVVEEMKKLANDIGESLDNIKAEFKKVYDETYLEQFEEEERCRQAAFIVKARRVNAVRSDGDWYEGKFISVGKSAIKTTTDKETKKEREFSVGSAYAIMAKADSPDAKIMLTEVTFFDDATKVLDDGSIEVDKCYRIKLQGGEQDGMLKLRTSVRPTIESIELDIPPAKDIVPKVFPVVPLAEASLPEHASSGFGAKPKLIRGRVLSARVNTTKKSGKDLGFYNITNDSLSASSYMSGESRDFTVMCDPSLVMFDAGSDCYFLGRISGETEEYRASMWADAVIPILGIPLERGISESTLNSVLPASEAAETMDMSNFGDEEEF